MTSVSFTDEQIEVIFDAVVLMHDEALRTKNDGVDLLPSVIRELTRVNTVCEEIRNVLAETMDGDYE